MQGDSGFHTAQDYRSARDRRVGRVRDCSDDGAGFRLAVQQAGAKHGEDNSREVSLQVHEPIPLSGLV